MLLEARSDAETASRSGLRATGHLPTRGGFTLVELVAVMVIMTILTFLAAPNMKGVLGKIQEVRCTANMRNIGNSLGSYLLDNQNVWPQGPPPQAGTAWENFWLAVLQPYGISESTWRCPGVDLRSSPDGPRIHYMPTMFPAVPGSATKWSTHPWLMERGAGHGQGPLIYFQIDGVKSFDKVLAECGAR